MSSKNSIKNEKPNLLEYFLLACYEIGIVNLLAMGSILLLVAYLLGGYLGWL